MGLLSLHGYHHHLNDDGADREEVLFRKVIVKSPPIL